MFRPLRGFMVLSLTASGLTACSMLGVEMPVLSTSSLPQLPSLFSQTASPVTARLQLLDGPVAAGPKGYCADPKASEPSKGFAVFSPCAVLGLRDAAPAINGIFTVQFGAAQTAEIANGGAAFAEMLRSDQAASMLAMPSQTVSIHDVERGDNAVTLRVTHGDDGSLPNTQSDEWRAFTDIDGRLVTLVVRGLADAPLTDDAGSFLLQQGITAMIAANSEKIDAES